VIGLVAGAVVGGVAGWLWLSDEGRRVRARLEPQLQELAGRALALRDSAARVQQAAREGARTVQQVTARAPRA
jgi:gas vesicle protein